MNIVVEIINGLKFGLEHVSANEEDEEDVSLIVFDVLFLRLIFVMPQRK